MLSTAFFPVSPALLFGHRRVLPYSRNRVNYLPITYHDPFEIYTKFTILMFRPVTRSIAAQIILDDIPPKALPCWECCGCYAKTDLLSLNPATFLGG
jgi:hypothetical protein